MTNGRPKRPKRNPPKGSALVAAPAEPAEPAEPAPAPEPALEPEPEVPYYKRPRPMLNDVAALYQMASLR